MDDSAPFQLSIDGIPVDISSGMTVSAWIRNIATGELRKVPRIKVLDPARGWVIFDLPHGWEYFECQFSVGDELSEMDGYARGESDGA